ncbi:MAG: S8 family peptidase [Clostridium sp.]
MTEQEKQKIFQDANRESYLVHYFGDFTGEMEKIDYAVGYKITSSLATVAIRKEDMKKLKVDVPSIDIMEFRAPYVLSGVTPSGTDGIYQVLENDNLDLTGRGVLIGLVDTGIDYLNEEFINEDGTSRILTIWDQSIFNLNTIPKKEEVIINGEKIENIYMGVEFNNEDINRAIKAKKNNENPYEIVPSKDEVGHGTMLASISGAKGYNKEVKGVASNVEFAVVKLATSPSFEKVLKKNNQKIIPVYNDSEIVAGVEYLKNVALKLKKPIVICIAVGATQGSHDGKGIFSNYLSSIGEMRGIVLVAGVGNQGEANGHATGKLTYKGEVKTIELNIEKKVYDFAASIWIQSPDRISVNIVSPSGEKTEYIKSNVFSERTVEFLLDASKLNIEVYDPEYYTGNQVIILNFDVINKGIWKVELRGESIVKGRYDMWIDPKEFISNNASFLTYSYLNTLVIPCSAQRVITVSYYNSQNGANVPSSGKGFNVNELINPDICAPGVNINSTTSGGGVMAFTGSSTSTAITAGVCALLLQWGVVENNDPLMYTSKMRGYLIYGASKKSNEIYPNEDSGYGFLNLLGTFKVMGGIYKETMERNVYEGYIGNLFQRMDNSVRRFLENKK